MQANGRLAADSYRGFDVPPPSSTYDPSMPSAGLDNGYDDPVSPLAPPADAVLNGYKGSLGQFDGHKSRNGQPRKSALVNFNDPVAMHLLVETALGDSHEFEILSFEELDALKREQAQLNSRIDGLRRKLALETKVRDATENFNRLPPKGGRNDQGDLNQSRKKCDDMTRDLWQMETRYRQIQDQILRHTAGVLQMTHEGPTSQRQVAQSDLPDSMRRGGRPDSPASINTYENSRLRDGQAGGDGFDERSLYRSADNLDGLVDPQRNGRRGGLHSRMGSIPAMDDGASMEQLLAVEKRLAEMNGKLRGLIMQANPDQPNYASPPRPTADSDAGTLDSQIAYLGDGIRHLTADIGSGSSAKADDYERRIQGLWDIIVGAEMEAKERKRQRRQMLETSGQTDELSDQSPDEDGPIGPFSIEAFSSKVQWLQRRTISLKEQQTILRRQIKQQRELNSKSDAQKDIEVGELNEQIFQLKRDVDEARAQAGASEELEMERQARARAEADLQSQISSLENALDEARDDARITAAESQVKVGDAEKITEQLRQAEQDKAAAEEAQKKAEAELREVEGEMVRLQTEVTIARAELDGAYGTRAQRAAEQASNPEKVTALEEEIEALKSTRGQAEERAKQLKEELTGTLGEFEELTKANIEAEKERERLEGVVDGMRDRCEGLEVQLADEKVRLLGVTSPGGPGSGASPMSAGGTGESTKTMVLKDAFKKMMRETRAEHMKQIKAEQEERRKLEATVRTLRKGRTGSSA